MRTYGIDVLAYGKESVPVRIAELTSGAHAIRYAVEKTANENKKVMLGLPTKCHPELLYGKVVLHSLMPPENDVMGYSEIDPQLLADTEIV